MSENSLKTIFNLENKKKSNGLYVGDYTFIYNSYNLRNVPYLYKKFFLTKNKYLCSV